MLQPIRLNITPYSIDYNFSILTLNGSFDARLLTSTIVDSAAEASGTTPGGEKRLYRVCFISACCVTILTLHAVAPCAAAEEMTADSIAREIFSVELEMQKINAQLHLEAADPSFKRARRTWLWDTANAISTEGGLISATALFWQHSRDKMTNQRSVTTENGRPVIRTKKVHQPNHVSGTTVAGTLYPQIVGQAIGGSGALFELTCDVRRSIRLHKMRLDDKSVLSRMRDLNARAERLLGQYEYTYSRSQQEMQLLVDFKHKILVEFIRLEGQAGNVSAGQYIEDFVSLIRNTVGLVGNSINASAVINNNRTLNGNATILNLVAASLVTTRPLMSNLGAKISKHGNRRRAKKFLPESLENQANNIEKDFNELASSSQASNPLAQTRIDLYRKQMEKFQEEESLAQFQESQSKQLASRRYRESIYGPTKMSQSILGLVQNFEHGNNATRQNRYAAAGNTTYTAGQIFNILELTRERIADERAHDMAKHLHMLPAEQIQRQLDTIDQLQKELVIPDPPHSGGHQPNTNY